MKARSTVVLRVEVEHEADAPAAGAVANALGDHADYLRRCLRAGDGPDDAGRHAVDDGDVHWQHLATEAIGDAE